MRKLPLPLIKLEVLSAYNVRAVCDLETTPEQAGNVAPNGTSIAEGHYEPTAWFRAIYAGEEPVGFVMLCDDPDRKRHMLWRLMIDRRQQRKGYGRMALELVIEHLRRQGRYDALATSFVPGPNEPRKFYEALGFQDSGEMLDGECVLSLDIHVGASPDRSS